MLDEALNKLGVPLDGRNEDPAASVEVESVPAEENAVEMVTDFVCDCGCRQPILRERRTVKLERPPVALLRADGGTTPARCSRTARSAAGAPPYECG